MIEETEIAELDQDRDFEDSSHRPGETETLSMAVDGLEARLEMNIWGVLESELTRLFLRSKGHRATLSPGENIEVFRRFRGSPTRVAVALGTSVKIVRKAIRDVRATLYWIRNDSALEGRESIPEFDLGAKEEERYQELRNLHEEAKVVQTIRRDEEMKGIL